jgi:hypothetical protein
MLSKKSKTSSLKFSPVCASYPAFHDLTPYRELTKTAAKKSDRLRVPPASFSERRAGAAAKTLPALENTFFAAAVEGLGHDSARCVPSGIRERRARSAVTGGLRPVISHPAAAFCIQVPTLEITVAVHSTANTRAGTGSMVKAVPGP